MGYRFGKKGMFRYFLYLKSDPSKATMKSFYFLLILTLTINQTSYCQNASAKDVFDCKEVKFYGFDFSAVKVADQKRMGQDLKSYFFGLSEYLHEHLSDEKLGKWIRKTVTSDFNPTFVINKSMNNENIVTASQQRIPKDSLQDMVNKYVLPDRNGIGYVFIFECLDSYEKAASAYEVFFDISTKKILWSEYESKHDGNSYNRMRDWNATTFMALKALTDNFLSVSGKKIN